METSYHFIMNWRAEIGNALVVATGLFILYGIVTGSNPYASCVYKTFAATLRLALHLLAAIFGAYPILSKLPSYEREPGYEGAVVEALFVFTFAEFWGCVFGAE